MGGWLQFGRGEVGWGRRRRNRGREEERVSAEAVYTGISPVLATRPCLAVRV